MKDILLQRVRIFSGKRDDKPGPPVDLLIRDGLISAIGHNLEPGENTNAKDLAGAWVIPGLVDIGAQTGDPGFEHREDLFSAAMAAAAGGFTTVACFPNTSPAVDGKSEVQYIINKSARLPVHFLPIGAVSEGCEGKDLAELYDMHTAGAIAFSDGDRPIQEAGLLLRALQYTQAFGGLVVNSPMNRSLSKGGQMHEGLTSTTLGMRGIPVLAETIMLERDLRLLAYAGGRLHCHLVSSGESVALLQAAKAAKQSLSAGVAFANLVFTDEQLKDFDPNFKVMPPLRSEYDRNALIQGLREGVLDAACTNHTPLDVEAKNLEFPYATPGITGLETAFALCLTKLRSELSLETLVSMWTEGPRKILQLPMPQIKEGHTAELCIFDPEKEWTFSAGHIHSKSQNTPVTGMTLRGKVLGIINKGQAVWQNPS